MLVCFHVIKLCERHTFPCINFLHLMLTFPPPKMSKWSTAERMLPAKGGERASNCALGLATAGHHVLHL